jgi:hypothetical protein
MGGEGGKCSHSIVFVEREHSNHLWKFTYGDFRSHSAPFLLETKHPKNKN